MLSLKELVILSPEWKPVTLCRKTSYAKGYRRGTGESKKLQVSIIIAAYNEEESIFSVLKEIEDVMNHSRLSYEIIVVNDGSTDRTMEVLRNRSPNVRVFSHKVNRGYGASLKTGICNAQHEIVVTIDADGTYPNERIPEIVSYMKDYDMVVGARTGANTKVPLIRKPAKWVIHRLANYLTGVRIPDLNSGLRAMKKGMVTRFVRLLPDGFSYTATLTLAMLTNGYQIKYVPVDYHTRTGQSKIRPIRDTLNFIQLIVRTVMYFRPLKVFLPLSLVLFFMSVAVFLYSYFFTPKVMDITTVILFVSAVQILAIGMVADLINKRIQ